MKYKRQVLRIARLLGFRRSISLQVGNQFGIGEIAPIRIRETTKVRTRLNLLVPSVNREHTFGGIATAVSFFRQLQAQLGSALEFRIITTDAMPGASDAASFPGYQLTDGSGDSEELCQLVAFSDRDQKTIPVSSGDYWVATAWWTAFLADQVLTQQEALFRLNTKRPLVYLIQDYEPGFYNWSSRYALAESTYKLARPTVAVFNSGLLRDYFTGKGYLFDETYHFDVRLNDELFRILGSGHGSKEKIILVYGRPMTPRNGFELIAQALADWSSVYPGAAAWKLLSVGEKHEDIKLSADVRLGSLGKLSIQEYGSLLRKTAIGISLMISPHPSYPPLEMAHFGVLTITNAFESKDLSRSHQNIYSVSDLRAESVARKLAELCSAFESDSTVGLKNLGGAGSFLDRSPQFPFLAEMAQALISSIVQR